MDTILQSLINIFFYPVTSRSFFLELPAMMCFIMGIWSLIGCLLKGDY